MVAASFLAAPLAVPVMAQAPATEPVVPVASYELEEITVTAQRFASSLQTTPIAVSAFSADMLDQRQVMNVSDLNSQIPGVLIQPAAGLSNIARIVLRGIGQENGGVLYDPAVGIYVDDVYQPRPQNQFFDFFDVERIEVLRGPQGTLYGRNTSGGALKIVTRKPSFDLTYGGDVALGSYNTTEFRGYVSGGLVDDRLAASLSTVVRKRDGVMDAPAIGDHKINDRNSVGVRGKLLFTPNEDVELELAGSYVRDHSDLQVGTSVSVLPGVTNPNAVPGRDLRTTELSGYRAQKTNSYNASANLSVILSDALSLRSTTAYGYMDNLTGVPFVELPAGVIGISYNFTDKFFSEELTLNYESDRFSMLGGVFYFYEKGEQEDTAPYTTPAFKDRTTDAYAAFGQGTFKITDSVSVTGGLRYTAEKAKFTQFYPTFAAFVPEPQSDSRTFKKLTPKVSLDWAANRDIFFYASFTEGFKSGGFNSISPGTIIGGGERGRPSPYGAETVKSYEVGGKFSTPDRRFRLNAALFQADYKGLHLPVFFPGTVVSTTNNAAGARVRGIELEPVWQVTPALQLYASAAILDGDYTSSFLCSLGNTAIVDCRDKDLKGVIPFKSNAGFVYTIDGVRDGALSLSGSWEHSEKFYNNVSNTIPLTATPAYDLFNATISWTNRDEDLTVSLEGRNITKETFAFSTLQISNATSPALTAYANEPRTFLVRVRFGL
ncbi:TonB-dependent receptor [Niveispirillum fermenti]